ncbi:MAG: alanine racemase [Planctomycetes bacterium]|nr:alanine racemase [Planctomycetota bacterium]
MPSPTVDPNLAEALRELGCAGATELVLGGMPARDLAQRFGTPLYVFDAAVLARRVARVRAALGPRVELLWSVKANPSLAVTRCLRLAGTGAEVASLGELHLALAAGHAAAALRFAGPGKTDAEIDAAVGLGLGCFHAESRSEVAAIAAAAARHGTRVAVAVRVNLPQELAGARMRMGGRSSRFGVDAEQVPALLRAIGADARLQLAGLHVYAGTQCFDAAAFVQHAQQLVVHAERWERDLGLALCELDLGGGFGTALFEDDPVFDLDAAGRGVRELVAAHDRADRRWFVELGRYLAAPAGVYLTRVVRTKTSGAQRHAALDGGMHQAAAAAGVGTVLRRAPLVVHATRLGEPAGDSVALGGPLCTPADQFGSAVPLPPLAEGDLVALLGAGAYGLSYSPHTFLSHATPAEVLVGDGPPRLARQRGSARDVLRDQAP